MMRHLWWSQRNCSKHRHVGIRTSICCLFYPSMRLSTFIIFWFLWEYRTVVILPLIKILNLSEYKTMGRTVRHHIYTIFMQSTSVNYVYAQFISELFLRGVHLWSIFTRSASVKHIYTECICEAYLRGVHLWSIFTRSASVKHIYAECICEAYLRGVHLWSIFTRSASVKHIYAE